MWIFPLLILVLSRLASAANNVTIDDASLLVTYNASALQRNITAFDSRLLGDGTVTYVVPTPDFSPTISIPFNGTAIYIFVAYPGRIEPAPSGFTALIDGVPAGGWAAAESALLYHHLVYHTAALPSAPHTLVMEIQPGWELYFDYAIYTSDADPPVAVVSTTSSSGGKQQSSSTVISTLPTPDASEPIVLTVSGAASTIDNNITSTVTQAVETSISVSISWATQQFSGSASATVSVSTLTLSGTSPAGGGTSQAAAATSSNSNNTTIIRKTGNLPVVPMISAFLGGALFATLVMVVCLNFLRRRRSRKRKRTAWTFNASRSGFNETSGKEGRGNAREKYESATDFWGVDEPGGT
ncbi:hypothetical protein C8R45DRAFT_164233 [Mycena sanguinolenta]|nr:hypothetical protein C8R45DRAFT_164233 [Mycena sanguinolenta]